MITSNYALEEARRNLTDSDKLERLATYAERMRVDLSPAAVEIPEGIDLREKDRPILAAAMASGATHLLTGDQRDFGKYFGRRVGTLTIMATRDYLQGRFGDRPRR